MYKKNIFFKTVIWFAAVVTSGFLSVHHCNAEELWGCATNNGDKLFGRIYKADVQESGWSGNMPPGWTQITGPEKPGQYYFDLGRLKPVKTNEGLKFQATRWNFINIALQDGFTQDAVVKKTKQILDSSIVRFKEDISMAEARKDFENLDRIQVQEVIAKDQKKIDFSISAKGLVVVKTTSGKLMKLFVENYASACYITAAPVDERSRFPQNQDHLIKIIEHSWRADLDRDGLIDLKWNPISHIGSSTFEVLIDYSIGLIKIYER
ncbi:MAG: hypothetical protein GF421_02895 [Candidatus Aminicenantes bacterium]|nr:hypothetical protein [Candidatus Aminicenantes bacterium]